MNYKTFFIRTGSTIFGLILLFAFSSGFKVCAQELTGQQRIDLCKEKKKGLDALEREAKQLRETIPKAEIFVASALKMTPKEIDSGLDQWIKIVESLKARLASKNLEPTERLWIENDLADSRKFLDFFTELKQRTITADLQLEDKARKALDRLKERQTEVGRQIFLLRDSIESLKCSSVESGFLGTWLFRGYAGAFCTVELIGENKLKLVTERNEVGFGYFENTATIVVDFPFARGLKGVLSEDGNRINWGNREFWVRVNP
jgi:hypothetical protein